jgi:hypothetical protein
MAVKESYVDHDLNGNRLLRAVIPGSAKWLDIIPLQSGGIVSGLLGADAAVVGSDFIWNSEYLPFGRTIALEVFAAGSGLTSQVTVALYTAAGVAVTGASVMITNTTTGVLARSGAFALTSGTTYQVHLKTTVLGTGKLYVARLILL